MAEHLVLVGMMGAGKTTLGQLVARRLSMQWVDTDDEVARETGASVAELFSSQGEERFRERESRVLESTLSAASPRVVSVGGGAVLDRASRALIRRSGVVVWLRAQPSTLALRLGDGKGRPLLEQDAQNALQRIDDERRGLYDEVAHAVIDTDELSLEELAPRVARIYRDTRADLAEGKVAAP